MAGTHRVRAHDRVVDGETIHVGEHDRTSQGTSSGSSKAKYAYQATRLKPARRKRIFNSDLTAATASLGTMSGLALVYTLHLFVSLVLAVAVVLVTMLGVFIGWQMKKRRTVRRTGTSSRTKSSSGTRTKSSPRTGTRSSGTTGAGARTGTRTAPKGYTENLWDALRGKGRPQRRGTPKRSVRVGPVRFVWGKR